jgi:DNA-binding NtrC family response regulator
LEERVNQFIELALMRLERAKLKGKGEILNKDNDESVYTEGIILLVDEDETNQNLMIKIFKRINYECVIAKDIYQAYNLLENHPIDVIVSEINLSKLDGFMLKQRINTEKTFEKIPFIITSHHKNIDVVMRANLLGIDLILQKPIIPEELIGHIKRIRDKRVRL